MRLDIYGTPVNSHSGGIYRFNGVFYLYGTAYQNCTQGQSICNLHNMCGFYDNRFVVYSSPDLGAWTLLNDNLVPEINHDADHVEYDEVNVGFNEPTQEYVMTFWSAHNGFQNSNISMARSKTPGGPFMVAADVKLQGSTVTSDTAGLFIDFDNSAYIRVNTRDLPFRHMVEKLDPTWSFSTGQYAEIFSKQTFPWYDGGGMFRRGDVYYG